MATWPTTFPDPLFSGYGLEAADQTVRTDMEGGPARVRRRTTSAPDNVTLKFLFLEDQMVQFRSFWTNSFLDGAAWVFMPIRDGRTAGMTSKECRPVDGKFTATPVDGKRWVVEMKVEVRNA